MTVDGPSELERLLDFFYRCPVGLISFGGDGRVRQINPEAVNLLVPALGTVSFDNVFVAFGAAWPELSDELVDASLGRVIDDHQLVGTDPVTWAISCTIVHVGDDHHMMVVADATERVAAEAAIRELLASEQAARERLELLEATAMDLATAVDVATVATTVLDALEASLGLTLTTVEVPEETGLRIIAGTGFPVELARAMATVDAAADLMGATAIRENATIHLRTRAEIEEQFPLMRAGAEQFGVGCVLALPLRSADKEAIGALVVGARDEHWFDQAAQSLLGGLAGQTGLAIERAKLFEQQVAARVQERAVAQRLQRALLPDRVIEHPAVRIGVRVTAASKALAVGGDWYHTARWPDGSVGVIVGDVVGHDLEAAAAMGRLRAGAAAIAELTEPSPVRLLDRVDEFAREESGAAFSTAVCVVLDTTTGHLRFASAGHPPPLVVGTDGKCGWLKGATSPPLGALSVASRREGSFEIAPDGTIVLYTDGLVERRDRSLADGLRQLEQTVSSYAGDDPQRLVDRLLTALVPEEQPRDDIAIVALRWCPPT